MEKGELHIRATIRLRNDDILSTRKEMKLSQEALAEASSIPISAIQALERMDYKPKEIFTHAIKLAEFLGLDLDQIIPQGADYTLPSTITTQRILHVNQLRQLQQQHAERVMLPPPDTILEKAELSGLIEEAMNKLTYREREVLKMRFNKHTYEEIGRRLRLSKGRAQQVEARAIRKLKTPRFMRKIEEELDVL